MTQRTPAAAACLLAASLTLLSLTSCAATLDLAPPEMPEHILAIIEEDGGVNGGRRRRGAAATRIWSVDGSDDARRYLLEPGVHELHLTLRNRSHGWAHSFDGRIEVDLPPGDYLLTGQVVTDGFELRLLPKPIGSGSAIVLAQLPSVSQPLPQANGAWFAGPLIGVGLARCF